MRIDVHHHVHGGRRDKAVLKFDVGPVTDSPLRVFKEPSMLTLTDTQKATLTIDPRNAKGNVALLDGVPQWSSSNPAVANITPAGDGLSAVVASLTPGTTQITVTADADVDAGEVREIAGTIEVAVKAGEAVTLGVMAGMPEEQTT